MGLMKSLMSVHRSSQPQDPTASYTATVADAGAPIAIVLTSTAERGNWDDVSLTTSAAAPEPGAWILLLLGMGAVGAATRNRQAKSSPRTFALIQRDHPARSITRV
jgi:hypothetical protein